jgi:hypothetical protein
VCYVVCSVAFMYGMGGRDVFGTHLTPSPSSSRFYVYDNHSQPPLRALLQPFIDIHLVVYEYSYGSDMSALRRFVNDYLCEWRDTSVNKQMYIYERCSQTYRHRHRCVCVCVYIYRTMYI